jgi:hypothetical protein
MGGIADTLFGSPGKEKSKSGNKAWEDIQGAFKPALGYVTNAGGSMWDMLKGGPAGFADSGGFKHLLEQGTNAVNSNFYARGLGQSGAAMKGLEKYRYGLASTYLSQYMDQLNNLGKLGIGAGGVMSSAGQYSKGSAKGGKDGIAGDIIGAIAMSDLRLKKNIEYAGVDEAGVPYYYFDYIDKPGRWYGVIAQELKKIAPDKVVEKNGYLAVKAPYLPRKI